MRFVSLLLLAALGGLSAPASAQESPSADDKSGAICRFHGDGCAAPPAEWAWKRLEPKIGVYSVEIPCDERQAAAFGQVLAVGKPGFPVGSTRACMKASSGFTATLIGLTALPDDTKSAETDALLRGAPDLFTAFAQQTAEKAVPVTTFKARRAAMNMIEKADGGRSKVAIIEVGRFALLMLIADIRADFPGTREEAEAVTERFFASLEIAE